MSVVPSHPHLHLESCVVCIQEKRLEPRRHSLLLSLLVVNPNQNDPVCYVNP